MSTQAQAVIGALYGDEGKGLMVDRLAAATPGAVVVRSNGGAQAGHTVVDPAGVRHVFHHIGAGSFAGAATHFSRFFVAHPMLLLDELTALGQLGVEPEISSDPRAPVTTPFDVIINQALELARGTARHGSCGLGFGETIERNLRPEFALSTKDLFRPDLHARLVSIRDAWVPVRLAALGITALPAELAAALADDITTARFEADCAAYLDRAALWPDRRLCERGPVIFEAAQGLELDQDRGVFPHVTRSNTGLANMLAISVEAGITELAATYATRCYTTRHGAGPLKGEVPALSGINIVDPTNAPNEWQGTLRLAPLDLDTLRQAIARDLTLDRGGITIRGGLAVTCLDQAEDGFAITDHGEAIRLDPAEAASEIADLAGLPLWAESWGPRRGDVRLRMDAAAA
ncbi:adenylosuccinate synthase [Rhizobium leguminosarum bv. trifolii CB782]|uniref:Adenylosuccinate synthetase n=1 Tax=Rhizobium hidalgonense TaxID=1538159 RepID=A0A2A6KIU8_9HYPH|nr:adenylosuccinate synthetase [Rhizobium hidalgonense]AHG47250.1 adenylosuccinate synthase [Rhizobium leguminosarum bv. trifolii CB782]MDR9773853.1 adenylosuccinate synthetase [Rhizobium hidalgonense]MDR9810821.1 adenylosuccinate synthetase [Rhizobium hidalgonense]MDR9819769.1 adenylosuccinate synthetase [Rhizobium hidalgonense]PDT24345.1 adenylosuccinate synthase [Rhizobium hidalgonense]